MLEDINWVNGMLISANHLKSIKKLNFYQIYSLINITNKFFYGIIKLKYDTSSLEAGVLVITQLQCLFSDGTYIDFDSNNNSNQVLCIQLNDKNINNGEEFIVNISSLRYDTTVCNNRTYIVTNNIDKQYDNNSEYVDYVNIKCSLLLNYEINANMVYLPIFKIQKFNNLYFLCDYIYLDIVVNNNTFLGNKVTYLLNNIISRTSVLYSQIKDLNYAQYGDYKLFSTLLTYHILVYDLYDLKQKINISISPYDLFNSLTNIYRKASSLNGQIADTFKFEVLNIHDTFMFLIDKIELLLNAIFYYDVKAISFIQNNNEYVAKYNSKMIFNNKIYVQCTYSSSFINNIDMLQETINNMLIFTENSRHNIRNTRVKGLERTIINDSNYIKQIIGILQLSNSIIIEVTINDQFFKENENIIIILPQNNTLNFNFNIICVNSQKI